MLGVHLRDIASQLSEHSVHKNNKTKLYDPGQSLAITTTWFLRVWFLGQIDSQWLESLDQYLEMPEHNYTFFQAIRLLFERGIHEPSLQHRMQAAKIIPTLKYSGPALEPTTWWEPTLQFELPNSQLKQLVTLAKQSHVEEIATLFPQVTTEQLTSDQPIVSADTNLLRAKMFIFAIPLEKPWPDLKHLVQFDPTQIYRQSQLPPEDQHREYKSTFRWDSTLKQKNPVQIRACLKTICGFLNTLGGTLVIGVDDEGNVIGLEGDFSLFDKESPFDEFSQLIHELIKQRISPIPTSLTKIAYSPYGHSYLAILTIERSSQIHYLNTKGSEPELFVRDGNRTLNLKGIDAKQFIDSRDSS
ncbi:MAG: ATP-binding protein [Fimbriimonadaceae bacterium]